MFITQNFKVKFVQFAQIVTKYCENGVVYEFCVTSRGKFKLLFENYFSSLNLIVSAIRLRFVSTSRT